MAKSVTDLINDIGEWFGINNKRMQQQTDSLERANRTIHRLLDANDQLTVEVERLRRENEELKGRLR